MSDFKAKMHQKMQNVKRMKKFVPHATYVATLPGKMKTFENNTNHAEILIKIR